MWLLFTLPFILQALVILIDEAYFHVKRGLPKWEKIGHPLDTLSTLVCFLFVLAVPYTDTTLYTYVALSIISCLMVTKDEFIHKEHCPGAENWLHALLFLLHPLVLILMGWVWPIIQGIKMSSWIEEPALLKGFLEIQAGLVFLFFLYQTIFWNIVWKEAPVKKL